MENKFLLFLLKIRNIIKNKLFIAAIMLFTITFPSMPKYKGNIDTWIMAFLIFIGKLIFYPIEYIIYALGSGIGAGLSQMFSSLFLMASNTYKDSINAFAFAGPVAPILVTLVWGISFVIIVFFIMMAVHEIIQSGEDDTGD